MPGIAGLITKLPRERAEPLLGTMVETLRHEPSYRTGTWVDEAAGVYVGWAARQGSFSDGMPLWNERRDVALVFSGEEFSEPGTARRLKDRQHVVDDTAASYLVHLYEEDPAFPAGLNGRFHGLVVDRARGTSTLFNDRFAMHRLYVHESKDAFYFAAEAKAILAACPHLRHADPRALGELVSCGCVLENRTLFANVHVLPGAAAWTFKQGSLERKGAYFHPRQWEEQPQLDPQSYYRELREAFARNLPRYFNGREPVAMSLTGGLDTRMIMAWHTPAERSLPCYTFSGMFREPRDVTVARKVAALCNQPHATIPVGKTFLSRFADYAERTVYLTDGCADVGRAPDLFVNERAREIAPVRMTGNYGGEVLRRVRAFRPMEPQPGLFRPELLERVREAAGTYTRQVDAHPLTFAVFRQAPWHHYGLLALEQTQVSLRSPYLDNDFVRTVFRAPASVLETNDVSLQLIADGNPALRRIRTDRGLGGGPGRLAGVAARSLLEFEFKADYAYDYGMPQWLARIDGPLSRFHLERLFLGRHKFYHFRVWYRDALSGYVRDMLLDPRTLSRPYIERATLENVVQTHLKGTRNYTTELHKVLTLELIHRLFLDRN
jgi:asparagine synthase (glutamine-hydrolysing)